MYMLYLLNIIFVKYHQILFYYDFKFYTLREKRSIFYYLDMKYPELTLDFSLWPTQRLPTRCFHHLLYPSSQCFHPFTEKVMENQGVLKARRHLTWRSGLGCWSCHTWPLLSCPRWQSPWQWRPRGWWPGREAPRSLHCRSRPKPCTPQGCVGHRSGTFLTEHLTGPEQL